MVDIVFSSLPTYHLPPTIYQPYGPPYKNHPPHHRIRDPLGSRDLVLRVAFIAASAPDILKAAATGDRGTSASVYGYPKQYDSGRDEWIGTKSAHGFSGSNNPDLQRIIELSRRAGVLAERAESGSSQGAFNNYADAALDVSPDLVKKFLAQQAELRKAHPETGPNYLTIARRLVEIPESQDTINGDTFIVRVQLQVQTTDNGKTSTEYRESTVRFDRQGGDWVITSYEIKPFTP